MKLTPEQKGKLLMALQCKIYSEIQAVLALPKPVGAGPVDSYKGLYDLIAHNDVDLFPKAGEPEPALEYSRVVETALDIAYIAGSRHYHSGDSRQDVHKFIELANEFERHRLVDDHGVESYFGDDYMTAIDKFLDRKLFSAV